MIYYYIYCFLAVSSPWTLNYRVSSDKNINFNFKLKFNQILLEKDVLIKYCQNKKDL